ncbi:MFS transporter [Actinomycetota bacterium]
MTQPAPQQPHPERTPLQRRTLGVLTGSQTLGGVGTASGIAVMALLTNRIADSEQLAGLGTTFQVLGGAILAIPLARLMAARGRRPGLAAGYAIAVLGCFVIVAAAALGSLPLMLVGSFLFGGATTSNSQARYAAADLAQPAHRGRDISIVVWATTIGSVIGPNILGVGERLAGWLHMPEMTGSFVFSMLGFVAAAAVLTLWLRPDPLLESRKDEVHDDPSTRKDHLEGGLLHGLRVILAHPVATLGLVTMAIGHAVMVGIMVMTPLHMDHGGASLRLVGLVISIHIFGMYAFSPLTGMAVDRFGARTVAVAGGTILLIAALMSSRSHAGMSVLITVSMLLIGVGWSCTLVSGSTMLTGALPVHERPGAQGMADLLMGLAAASGGAVAGVILEHFGFGTLSLIGALLSAGVALAAMLLRDPQGELAH